MKKGFIKILTCTLLGSLLLCGCGKKLEKVSAEELVDNAKISSKELDVEFGFDVDADITVMGEASTIAMAMSGNMKSDEDCVYLKVKADIDAEGEIHTTERELYYVGNSEGCMEYSSYDGNTWYGSMQYGMSTPVDVNSLTSSIKSDMLKELKVENKEKEYVVTGKLDVAKAMEVAGYTKEDLGLNDTDKIVVDVTMKFNADKELKYLAVSVDGSSIPENDSITVRKCEVTFNVNKTGDVSVECPEEVIDNAI